MTLDEWTALSYSTFGEWWDAPQTKERQRSWFGELQGFSADRVLEGLRSLLRESPKFPPRLGELVNVLSERPPAWEFAWAHTLQALRLLPGGERAVVQELVESAGVYVAGWVALYGPQRLALEPVHDSDHGGATLHRLRQSWCDSVSSVDAQGKTALGAERVLKGLPVAGGPRRIDAAGLLGEPRRELGSGDGA